MSESNYKRSGKTHEKDLFDSDEEISISSKKRKTTLTKKKQPTKAEKKVVEGWLSDSENEQFAVQKAGEAASYFIKRVANGTVRRRAYLEGELVADVRLYNANDVRDLGGLERWEKAIVALRFQGEGDSEEFDKLKKFLKSARNKFSEEGTFFQDKKKN